MTQQGKFHRDTLLKDLRAAVVEVQFIKEDGQPRTMRCTLRPDLLPAAYVAEEGKQEKEYHSSNPDVIAAWSVDDKGWRAFNINRVQYTQDVNLNY